MPDSDGFDEFYRGSRQRLLGFVYVLTGDLAEAQDAVQEAYIRAWQRWSTVRGYDDPESWVRVVASRIAVSR
ncbi:sigma factor, partial [Micromonospora sp. NPDC005313]